MILYSSEVCILQSSCKFNGRRIRRRNGVFYEYTSLRKEAAKSRQKAGSTLPVLQFYLSYADHRLLSHHVFLHCPEYFSGGRGQPPSDVYDLCAGSCRVPYLYRIRFLPVFPQKIKAVGNPHGSWRFQETPCAGTFP